jgi:hypothetical protein
MSDTTDALVVSMDISPGNRNAPDEEKDLLTRQLLRELRECGLDAARVRKPGVPGGAKAGEMLEAGSLLLSLLPTVLPTVLPKLVEVLGGWLGRGTNRHLRMKMANGAEFELTGDMSFDHIQQLLARMNSTAAPSVGTAAAQ